MRAPYNTTCTLYDGPGTGTPGFPRVVGLECRLVSDPLFRDKAEPLRQGVTYLTAPADQMRGAVTTDTGGGVWTYDYAKADRCEVALLPGVIWVVARVESCTGPEQAPYDRGSLILVETPPPGECSDGYGEVYNIKGVGFEFVLDVTRVLPTKWENGETNLVAEDDTPNEECVSLWRVTLPGGEFFEGNYNGTGVAFFDDPFDPTRRVQVNRLS